MIADQTFDSAFVELSRFGSLTQREAAVSSASQRFAPLLFVSSTLAWASGVSPSETAWRDPNIALMNELSLVFQALNIDAGERASQSAPAGTVRLGPQAGTPGLTVSVGGNLKQRSRCDQAVGRRLAVTGVKAPTGQEDQL